MVNRLTCLLAAAVALTFVQQTAAQCIPTPDNTDVTDPAQCGTIFTYTENNNVGNNIALGYPVPIPVSSLTAGDFFRAYDDLFAQHQALMVVNAEVTGTIVGMTAAGENIWAYQFGDVENLTADGFTEPAILMTGSTHAREWQPAEAVTEVLETLVEQKNDNGIASYLRDNLNIVLVPVTNIDGFRQTQMFPDNVTALSTQPRDGRMRRKTMRDSATLQFKPLRLVVALSRLIMPET